MLKLKYNDVQTEPIKSSTFQIDVNQSYINTEDLLTKGIAKYFFGEELQTGFYNLYNKWFELMAARLMKNTPFIFEKSVLVKVTCKNPAAKFFFFFLIKRTNIKTNAQS